MDTNTDGPACCDDVTGGSPPGARASRPHNTGTASPHFPTRLDRQRRQDSASAEPTPFPPAGWPCAASRENGAATQRRGCGRDARAPGGAPPPIILAPRGGTAPAVAAKPSRLVSLRRSSCAFVDSSFFVCFRQAPPLPYRADHPRVKHSIVNKGEPRMNTNGHEYRWTCFAATTSREEALRERGRPARTTLAQPHPSPPPGSTGNGATIPLQSSRWGSRRQGGRAPHHVKTERPPNAEDAGGTPALPGGGSSRRSWWITLFFFCFR